MADTPSLTSPSLAYWHVWVDEAGMSRQGLFAMTGFTLAAVAAGVAPQWNDRQTPAHATVVMTVLPVGWVGDWHENPRPQWIVPLSGVWFVETMDGTRVEMGPGELSFGEDQNTVTDARGRAGHLSGTVGDQPAVLLCVTLDVTPTVNQPGRFS